MAGRARRGEIWLFAFRGPDKERPVVVLTRQQVIGLLRSVMVAPVTSTVRGAPGEVIVGVDEGLEHTSAVNLDHLRTVAQRDLHRFIGRLEPEQMRQVCTALAIAVGCAD